MTKHWQQRIEYLKAGGLLIDNGDRWWRIRSKTQQPLLKPKNMKNYLPAIGPIADKLVDRFVVCLITTRKFQIVRKTEDGVNGLLFLNNITGSNLNFP
jgi:cytochrome P450